MRSLARSIDFTQNSWNNKKSKNETSRGKFYQT